MPTKVVAVLPKAGDAANREGFVNCVEQVGCAPEQLVQLPTAAATGDARPLLLSGRLGLPASACLPWLCCCSVSDGTASCMHGRVLPIPVHRTSPVQLDS